MRSLGVAVFLVAQMAAVHWMAGELQKPPVPDRASFPAALGNWRLAGEDPVDPGVAALLGSDLLISRIYSRQGVSADVLVAWFQWQQEGSRQIHTPLVCLPASGWVTEKSEKIALDTRAGAISVNRLSIRSGEQRGAMVYWYQNSRRVIAGDWVEKFSLIEGAVRDRRTDGAFVRVFVPFAAQQATAAAGEVESAAAALYPALRDYLPR